MGAVTLGTLLNAFQLEEGEVGPNKTVVVEALPKFLTYDMVDAGVHSVGVVAAVRAVDVVAEANQEPIGTAKKAEAELRHVMDIVIHSLSQISRDRRIERG